MSIAYPAETESVSFGALRHNHYMMRKGLWYRIAVIALTTTVVLMLYWTVRSSLKPSVSGTIPIMGTLISVVTLTGLLQNWKGARNQQIELVSGRNVHDAADKLAESLKKERKDVERRFRLNDPYLLPVPWRAAGSDLADDLETQRRVAMGAPGFIGTAAAEWISQPAELSGQGNELANILMRCPAKRLLVLGERGAGKTILLSRLQWDLLEKREPGDPVPVIFPLTDWRPGIQDLHSWMAERLVRDYPAMSYPRLDQQLRSTKATALIEAGLILPILDGFDEIPPGHMYAALDKINQSLLTGQAVVMASQTDAYRRSLSVQSGADIRLTGATVIEVQPVPAEAARDYLLRDAGGFGTQSAARWNSVIRLLDTDTHVGEALRTPLILFLCRTIYNARPADHLEAVPHPAELCDLRRFPSVDSIREHLASAYIPAVYRSEESDTAKKKMNSQQAIRAHRALARYMSRASGGTTEFRWWNFHRVSSDMARALGIIVGGLAFLASFLPALGAINSSTLIFPVLFGAIAGVCTWASLKSSRRALTSGLHWRWRFYPTAFGAAGGYVLERTRYMILRNYPDAGYYPSDGFHPPSHPTVGASIMWIICGASLLAATCGWTPKIIEDDQPIGPCESLRIDRKTFIKTFSAWLGSSIILTGFVIGTFMHKPFALNVGTTTWALFTAVISVAAGTVIGIGVGLIMAFRGTAWGMFLIARPARAIFTGTPLHLISFLEEAHRLGVLRKMGPVYQFRHAEIQRSLLREIGNQ